MVVILIQPDVLQHVPALRSKNVDMNLAVLSLLFAFLSLISNNLTKELIAVISGSRGKQLKDESKPDTAVVGKMLPNSAEMPLQSPAYIIVVKEASLINNALTQVITNTPAGHSLLNAEKQTTQNSMPKHPEMPRALPANTTSDRPVAEKNIRSSPTQLSRELSTPLVEARVRTVAHEIDVRPHAAADNSVQQRFFPKQIISVLSWVQARISMLLQITTVILLVWLLLRLFLFT